MTRQPNHHSTTAAHPTNRDFVEQLRTWGFTQRKDDGVHLVFRGPHGGTLRVVRSLLGRAEEERVRKAAHLAGITIERFWAGPDGDITQPQQPQPVRSESTAEPQRSAARDRDTSLVLSVHAEADRPLGFEQVVELAGDHRITREQVRSASAYLCREGDLVRIRRGVYQWSGGVRAETQAPAATPAPAETPFPQQDAPAPARTMAMHLFEQLFPTGVRMTADMLADIERWTELTEKLAEHARAS